MNTVQLSVLLKYIDYELEKLKLIRISYPRLTDKANRKDLEKNFRFESSVLELNKFYKTTDQSTEVVSKKCEVASEENKINAFSEKLSPYTNDSQRFEVFKKTYGDYCFTAAQVKTILNKFLHDREKLDAAFLMYDRCVEKEKYLDISGVFSYNQSVADLKDFIEKQK